MTVMNAGWSWGGCFADFDNDGFLDLYVLSGYFTAPKELSSDLDLESNLWRTMVRTDENLSRPSFRFSPEWKRTPPPDNLGPEIDARLAGVERQGDKVSGPFAQRQRTQPLLRQPRRPLLCGYLRPLRVG